MLRSSLCVKLRSSLAEGDGLAAAHGDRGAAFRRPTGTRRDQATRDQRPIFERLAAGFQPAPAALPSKFARRCALRSSRGTNLSSSRYNRLTTAFITPFFELNGVLFAWVKTQFAARRRVEGGTSADVNTLHVPTPNPICLRWQIRVFFHTTRVNLYLLSTSGEPHDPPPAVNLGKARHAHTCGNCRNSQSGRVLSPSEAQGRAHGR